MSRPVMLIQGESRCCSSAKGPPYISQMSTLALAVAYIKPGSRHIHTHQFHNCHKCQNEPRLDANKSTIFFICYIALCPILYFTRESKVRPEFKCQPSPFQCASAEWEWLQGYSNHGRKNVLPWPELQRMEWPAVHLYSAVSLGGATP